MTLRKSLVHRWDRLAQNHSAVKNFLRKDWVQDDGEVEEEQDRPNKSAATCTRSGPLSFVHRSETGYVCLHGQQHADWFQHPDWSKTSSRH